MPRPIATRPRFSGRPLAVAATVFLTATLLAQAGVRFGDAVPAIIGPRDLEVLKDRLHLTRFSIIAAVHLGAVDGRELILAEPLSDEALEEVRQACEAGGFCPDPYGFVASRVRVVLLRDLKVETVLTVDDAAHDEEGPIFSPAGFGVPGRLIGWNGVADAASGHVALVLTPIVRIDDAPAEAGDPVPYTLAWDEERGRFALYECAIADDGTESCEFYRDEPDADH
jgi:hypothetical protein